MGKARGRALGEEIGFYAAFSTILKENEPIGVDFPLSDPHSNLLDSSLVEVRGKFRGLLRKLGQAAEGFKQTEKEKNQGF